MDGAVLNDLAREHNARLLMQRDAAACIDLPPAVNQALGRPLQRLAVYGTLAPGQRNNPIVADIKGTWTRGWVEGTLHQIGWGAEMGFPAMRWQPGGPHIDVHVLRAADLPAHWPRLDEFEGSEYRRILIPVFFDAAEPRLANIYASRK